MSTAPHFPWQAAGLSFCLLHFTRAGESTQRELFMTDDNRVLDCPTPCRERARASEHVVLTQRDW